MNKFKLTNTIFSFILLRSKLTNEVLWSALLNEYDDNICIDSEQFDDQHRLFHPINYCDTAKHLWSVVDENVYEVISGEINLTSPISIENQIERVILIHDDKYTNSLNIRIGDVLNHYDDGKIRVSRRSQVIITNVIEYDKVEKHIKKQYKKMLKDEFNSEFYINSTSHFIFAESISDPSDKYIYVESARGWYSFNAGFLNNGLLDIHELANPF